MTSESKRVNQDMLKQALKTGDLILFDYLLTREPWLADEKFGRNLNKPLHIACEYGRVEMVRVLLEKYLVEVNPICALTGYTPLMYAA